jgi:sulfur carrier protein
MPESLRLGETPEPDTGHAGVGKGTLGGKKPCLGYVRGCGFFVFFMRLTVNGAQRETGARTLAELIEELSLHPERVAAEVNLSIINKKDYGTCGLKEGDSVELVNFVGGG